MLGKHHLLALIDGHLHLALFNKHLLLELLGEHERVGLIGVRFLIVLHPLDLSRTTDRYLLHRTLVTPTIVMLMKIDVLLLLHLFHLLLHLLLHLLRCCLHVALHLHLLLVILGYNGDTLSCLCFAITPKSLLG